MTDNKCKRKKILATDGFVVDLLMSFIFILTTLSVELVAIRYVQADVPYNVVMIDLLVVIIFTCLRRLQVDIKIILAAHPVVAVLLFGAHRKLLSGYYDDWFAMIFLIAVLFFNMIYSLSCMGKKSTLRAKPEGMYFSLLVHLLLFFAVGLSVTIYPILVNAVLMVMCYLAARQMDIFETKYAHSISSSSQSSSEIRQNNRKTVVILLISVMVSMCALFLFPYDAFYAFILACLRALFKILNSLADDPEAGQPEMGENLDFEFDQSSGETPLLLKMILSVVVVAVSLLMLNFFGTLLINFIKSFRLPKFELYRDSEKEDLIVTDLIEDIAHDRKKIKRRDMGKGEEYRIRKKYYDKVRRAVKKGVPIRRSSTPGQIERLIREAGDSSISELTPIYQEIRYNKKGSSQ